MGEVKTDLFIQSRNDTCANCRFSKGMTSILDKDYICCYVKDCSKAKMIWKSYWTNNNFIHHIRGILRSVYRWKLSKEERGVIE